MKEYKYRSRIFVMFCISFSLIWITYVCWQGAESWFHKSAETTGTVIATYPENHALIISEYTVDKVKYQIQRSGDCKKFEPGDKIDIFYRIDQPAASDYRSFTFSVTGLLGQLLFGLVLVGIFYYASSKLIKYTNIKDEHSEVRCD